MASKSSALIFLTQESVDNTEHRFSKFQKILLLSLFAASIPYLPPQDQRADLHDITGQQRSRVYVFGRYLGLFRAISRIKGCFFARQGAAKFLAQTQCNFRAQAALFDFSELNPASEINTRLHHW